jgi:hypothetical protein
MPPTSGPGRAARHYQKASLISVQPGARSHDRSAIVLLMIYGSSSGRAAHLRGRQLLAITPIAATLGLLMILLKDVVLIHLH